MPSVAYEKTLRPLLVDADELNSFFGKSVSDSGESSAPPFGHLAISERIQSVALLRASVVMTISAWEAYVETVVLEAVERMKPPSPPAGSWSSLNASVRGLVGRFNTPNVDQVRILISDSLGLSDVTKSWAWGTLTDIEVREKLKVAMDLRHSVAHGVNPRPAIHSQFAMELPDFFRELGRATDTTIRDYLVTVLGIPDPWPG